MTSNELIYHKENSRGKEPNPLLEALPPFDKDPNSLMDRFDNIRTPDPSDRKLDLIDRVDILDTVNAESYYCFQSWHLKIAVEIDSLIRYRYTQRNPLKIKEENEKRMQILKDSKEGVCIYSAHSNEPAPCMSIVAPAGIGKTTAVERKLSEYPVLIRHTEYNGEPLECFQIPYLFIQVPGNGTIKSFVLEIYRKLDELIPGQELFQKNRHKPITELINGCANLLNEFNVGILVLDETEQLLNGFREKDKILDFLTYAVNTLGIPVVFMGTPRFMEMLRGPLHFSRRAGKSGQYAIGPMEGDDWEDFITQLWDNYQFTKTPTKLTSGLKDLMLKLSCGNPSETIAIFCEAQRLAMLDPSNKEEALTDEVILNATEQYHNQTADVLRGVSEGDTTIRAGSPDAFLPDQASLLNGRQVSFFEVGRQDDIDLELMGRYEVEKQILSEAAELGLGPLLGQERMREEIIRMVGKYKPDTEKQSFVQAALRQLLRLAKEASNEEAAA